MQTNACQSRCHEFYFPDVDTLIRVESAPGGVTIRASRDTFTERRKHCFIRELAAEAFIPDDYEWRSLADSEFSRGARWLIDHSWLETDPAMVAETRRFMLRLLAGGGVLWIGLIAVLLLTSFG